jgi:predicted metal-dependent phosphoesterase TrpH
VPDRSAAFASILHWRGGYYRPHEAPPPVEGVRIIADAGGVPVIAHPGGRGPERLFTDKRIAQLVDAGLFGLEVDHRDNPVESRPRWAELASRHGLVTTGASDYHGAGKPNRLGENTTSPEVYAAILERGTGWAPFAG